MGPKNITKLKTSWTNPALAEKQSGPASLLLRTPLGWVGGSLPFLGSPSGKVPCGEFRFLDGSSEGSPFVFQLGCSRSDLALLTNFIDGCFV